MLSHSITRTTMCPDTPFASDTLKTRFMSSERVIGSGSGATYVIVDGIESSISAPRIAYLIRLTLSVADACP